MGLRTVQYTTNKKIVCAGCNDSGASVILCVNPEKVGFPDCPAGMTSDNDDEQTYIRSYVEATIYDVKCVANSCNNKYYIYTFQYDDVQLVADTTLVPSDITGVVCQDCLTQWVQDYVGNDVEVSVNEDSGLVTITNEHGCQAEFYSANGFGTPIVWDSTITKNGAGTFVVDDFDDGEYSVLGKWVKLSGLLTFTVSVSPINYVNFSLPINAGTYDDSLFVGGQFQRVSGGAVLADGFGQVNGTAANLTLHSALDAGFAVGTYEVSVNVWYRID